MIFQLGNVRFNDGGELVVKDFTPGPHDIEDNDEQRPMGDGIIVGSTFEGAAIWAFDIETRAKDEAGALAANAALQAAWKDPAVRLRPNVTVPLSYMTAGRWRRVYGRPASYAGPNGDTMTRYGRGKITCDFKVTDPLHYDETETAVLLTIVPATAGGLVAPLVAPIAAVGSSAPRAGLVTNTGDAETPLKVVFHGPIVNPWIRAAAGWEIGLIGSIPYDGWVTVDPMAGTVNRSGGAPAAGMLTRATRLRRAVLPPGPSELTFGGQDPTGTATASLKWRNAHTSI